MPTFAYQAKQGPSDVVEGTLQAATRDEVVAQLMRQGLVPVTVVIASDAPRVSPSRVASRARIRSRLCAKDRRLFVRQLTSLMRAKVELVPAISILHDQSPSPALSRLLEDLERHMRDGNPFSEALRRHPAVFNSFFVTAIEAGEAAGTLDQILEKLVDFSDQQELLESRLTTAMTYPLLLGLLGLGCLVFFVTFVVPRMTTLFVHLGGALPWPTQVLISTSDWLIHYWAWALGGCLAGGWLLRRLMRTAGAQTIGERLMAHVPLGGEILEAKQIGRFTRTLQLLLESGLPVFQALEVATPTLSSRSLEARMARVQERVKEGTSISESLIEHRCFPPMVNRLIGIGEQGGTLTDVLKELARFYERSLDEHLRILSALLEPVMIMAVGLVVGFCVLAMILPIFQMNQLIR